MAKKYDFSGYVTKYDLKCADGRTIRRDAFKDNDGQTVPLVWGHLRDNPNDVLGHMLLEKRSDGMYGYGAFNATEGGQTAKELVQHGDITAMSIYANKLKQQDGNVLHGVIREVSLVLAGANPGAYIDFPVLEHDDDPIEEAIIYTGEELSLEHEEPETETQEEPATEEVEHSAGEEIIIRRDMTDEEIAESLMHADEETIESVLATLSEKQRDVVAALVAIAVSNAKEIKHAEGGNDMKTNIFDTNENAMPVGLSADQEQSIIKGLTRYGSLKESFIQHADQFNYDPETCLMHADSEDDPAAPYGIGNIGYLFPDYRTTSNEIDVINNDVEWVNDVMSGVSHTPFSRIKSIHADITEDEARAKGYIKGKYKKEEFFSLMKRTTDPQTVYKKQKFDRDDIADITDFNTVGFIKSEMRGKLNEELAGAYLFGDGRLASDEDKIQEAHIRPIMNDDDLYAVKVHVDYDADRAVVAKNALDTIIRARKEYKGSGSPKMYVGEDWVTEWLLLEDGIGHKYYKTEAELATALRVSKIVPVPVADGKITSEGRELICIIVNLKDYKVGADKGGALNMFEDFDIDYNQMKYLIETRCSAALVKAKSALVVSVATSA